ncbi:Dehydrogenase patE [Penicillium angulare]|uniref:Dehydrogenase patE n=1 Tax=Penicillium angulare TaxID=116970 RepID=UPI0025406C75|nr:Dehydrogenase patE [Penicillium angulare]KAJ5273652.1 Dehydrogenase patE [Penicillium angulare]
MFLSIGQLGAAIFGALISILAFNTWAPFDAIFDYVVVGGGTAGVTVGVRLAQHGFRVALVEAGGYYELKNPIARIPGAAIIGIGASPKSSTPVDWKFVAHAVPGAGFRDIHYPRGKCLGGSPSKDAMRIWADLVDDTSYLFENCFPLYKKTVTFSPPVGRAAGVPSYKESSFSSSGEPLHVSYPKHAMEFSNWAQDAFTEAGLPEAEDFNSGSLMGHQFCTMTIRPTDQTRSTSESAFMGGFKQLENVTVYQKTLAKKILFDGERRAIGVRVKHKWSYTLKATKEVIISAGAFQSPQLLMVSGVGPVDTLQKHGITVVADRPGVGQNMWDHVFFGPSYPVTVNTFTDMVWHLDHLFLQVLNWLLFKKGMLSNPSTDYLGFEKIPSQFRSILSARDEEALSWFPADWPEVEYLVASAYVGNFSSPFWQQPSLGQYGSIVASIVAPTSRGNVMINSANMADPPIINPNWLATETDQRVAVAAYKRIRDIFNTTAMKPVLAGPEYFPGFSVSTDDEILALIKQTMMTIYHAACTCKMGVQNDSMAVVDSRARVFGVSGLRVVDASAFPILPAGHPQSTVYMLAEKIAADILAT